MAAEIEPTGHGPVELVAGSNGVFDVELDGRTVFSKARTGRFPEPGEIARILTGRGS